MNPQMRKRLDSIEGRFAPNADKCGVVFTPLKGESDQEYDARIGRWFAGEKVEGQERMYTGREVGVLRVVYVEAKCPQ